MGTKIIYRLIIISLLLATIESCSFISRVAVLEPTKESKDSTCKTCYNYDNFIFKTKAAEYVDDSMSIIACPAHKPGRMFLWGPLLIPVIPNPLVIINYIYPSKQGFYVNIKMNSNITPFKIDLKNFMFYDQNDSIIKPDCICCTGSKYMDEYSSKLCYPCILKETEIYLEKKAKYYCFHFNISNLKVKELTIKYDTGANKKELIRFKKKIKLKYNPMFTGNGQYSEYNNKYY